MRVLIMVSLWITCGLLSSCFSPIQQTPPKTYLLTGTHSTHHNRQVIASTPTSQKIILLLPVETDALYDTVHLLYTTQPYQISYFIRHQWAETPGSLLSSLILQTLQDSQHFKIVLIPPAMGPYDELLKIRIQKIQQNFSVSPAIAELTIEATLYDAKRNTFIATKKWQLTQPLVAASPEEGVRALNQATHLFLKNLIIFLNSTHTA